MNSTVANHSLFELDQFQVPNFESVNPKYYFQTKVQK